MGPEGFREEPTPAESIAAFVENSNKRGELTTDEIQRVLAWALAAVQEEKGKGSGLIGEGYVDGEYLFSTMGDPDAGNWTEELKKEVLERLTKAKEEKAGGSE